MTTQIMTLEQCEKAYTRFAGAVTDLDFRRNKTASFAEFPALFDDALYINARFSVTAQVLRNGGDKAGAELVETLNGYISELAAIMVGL